MSWLVISWEAGVFDPERDGPSGMQSDPWWDGAEQGGGHQQEAEDRRDGGWGWARGQIAMVICIPHLGYANGSSREGGLLLGVKGREDVAA